MIKDKDRMAVVKEITSHGLKLQFYGETATTEKAYKRLESYTPQVNDVVYARHVNGTYIVIGKVV